MPNAPDRCPLRLAVELALPADPREVQICVRQYVSQLCKDLALPVDVFVSVTRSDPKPSHEAPLKILLNGKPFPMRLWPALNLPEQPSTEDAADAIARSLFDGREGLLTDDVFGLLSSSWGIRDGETYANGWSDAGFLHFVRLFVRYNFSLRHAQSFLEANQVGAASEMAACCLFENVLEDAPKLLFGGAVAICPKEFEDNLSEYETAFTGVNEGLDFNLGMLCPKVRITKGVFRQGEYQLQINDVHLPILRGGSAEDLKVVFKAIVWANAGSFVMSPPVRLLLDKVEKATSNLLVNVRDTFRTGPQIHRWITAILRCLLDEQVSISDLIGILESLLSLREVKRNQELIGVYHFSQLEDSPVPIAANKTVAALSKRELVAAARLGVPSLTVRQQNDIRNELDRLPLDDQMQKAILATPESEPVSELLTEKVLLLLKPKTAGSFALVVGQSVRSEIRDRLKPLFPDVPVFGKSEASRISP